MEQSALPSPSPHSSHPILLPTPAPAVSWSPSKAAPAVLDTASLPIPKTHKGWDRAPHSPLAGQTKAKKVWRRYEIRQQQPEEPKAEELHSPEIAQPSPVRVVKKLRIKSPRRPGGVALEALEDEQDETAVHAPTRWDHRSNRLGRKVRSDNPPEPLTANPSEGIVQPNTASELDISTPTTDLPVQDFPNQDALDDSTQDLAYSQSETNDSPQTISSAEVTEEAVRLDLSQAVTLTKGSSTTEPTITDEDVAISPVRSHLAGSEADVVYPAISLEEDEVSSDDAQEDDSESDEASPKRSGYNDTLRLLRPESTLINATPDFEESILEAEEDHMSEAGKLLDPPSPTTNLDFFTKPGSHPPKVILSAPETDVNYPTLSLSVADDLADPYHRNGPDELSLDLDATETFTTMLEDDKAILRNFLSRAAANKASKTASMSRRESLQNRRDSDAVRHALASPRPALQEKDANLSPVRDPGAVDNTQALGTAVFSPLVKRSAQDGGLDATKSLTAADDRIEDELAGGDAQDGSPRRRSARNIRSSKIPHLPSAANAATPNKIPVRTDGGERVLLNRTEAQQLADLVRKNTRKNKGGAIAPVLRLLKLQTEALTTVTDPVSLEPEEIRKNVRGVRWREVLEEFSTAPATADLDASSSSREEVAPAERDKEKEKKAATPRTLRRLKNPAATKSTPSRNVLTSTLLPEEVQEELQAAKAASAATSTLPSSTSTTNAHPAPQKSKIKPPSSSSKKLLLNPTVSSLSALPVLAGKENMSQLLSPAKKLRSKMPVPATVPSTLPVAPAIEAKPIKRGGRVRRA